MKTTCTCYRPPLTTDQKHEVVILSLVAAGSAWGFAVTRLVIEAGGDFSQLTGSDVAWAAAPALIAVALINGALLFKRRVTALRSSRACHERGHMSAELA